jgi:hypothetical protein
VSHPHHHHHHHHHLLLLLQDDKGKSKCFGFINYADTDAAGKAVEALTGDY